MAVGAAKPQESRSILILSKAKVLTSRLAGGSPYIIVYKVNKN